MSAARKVKFSGPYEFNPRGNIWMNDDSTLGHRLLAKMGWKKGKGIGKNEDGMTECLKIRCKNAYTGLGWKEKHPLQAQSEELDSVLSSIAQAKAECQSLVKRHRMLGNRYRYHKVLKQKDMTRYSKTDMKCIFMVNPGSTEGKLDSNEKEELEPKPQIDVKNSSSVYAGIFTRESQSDVERRLEGSLKEPVDFSEDYTFREEPFSGNVDPSPRKSTNGKSSDQMFKRTESRDCLLGPVTKSASHEAFSFSLKTNILPSGKKDCVPSLDCSNARHSVSSCLQHDPWVDCQKQALKMKLYKNMLACLRKHKILQTCNLLSIKGYGN